MRNVAKTEFKNHFLVFEGCSLCILPAKCELNILMYTRNSVGPESQKKKKTLHTSMDYMFLYPRVFADIFLAGYRKIITIKYQNDAFHYIISN